MKEDCHVEQHVSSRDPMDDATPDAVQADCRYIQQYNKDEAQDVKADGWIDRPDAAALISVALTRSAWHSTWGSMLEMSRKKQFFVHM